MSGLTLKVRRRISELLSGSKTTTDRSDCWRKPKTKITFSEVSTNIGKCCDFTSFWGIYMQMLQYL